MRELRALLEERFGKFFDDAEIDTEPDVWRSLAQRGSARHFKREPIEAGLIERLAALALCAPTKSDLQQRDIIHVSDPDQMARIKDLVEDQPWIANVPSLLIFCGNNRRQRQIHSMHGHPFVNDHLDSFFNAAVDAGVALSAFVIAAEAAGLGCCPISGVRNRSSELSSVLQLPDYVFPVAGLALGWPDAEAAISPRLPLSATLHENTFTEQNILGEINTYDQRREAIRPYKEQRGVNRFGVAKAYGWSQDKARQYAEPERVDFGDYIRNQGFKLD